MNHTPGPWLVDATTGLDVRVAGGLDVAISLCKEMNQLQFNMETIEPETRAEAYANARLIAAAPELLQALIEIEKLGHGYGSGFGYTCANIAQKAIAKATS